jgi:hypothetical protein
MNVRTEVPPAAISIITQLKHHAKQVLSGHAPASLPKPEPEPAPAVIEQPAPTQRYFAMQSIKWTDAKGELRFCQQYEDADLTPAAAQRGLRCNAVVPLADARRKSLKGARGGEHVSKTALDLIDLDDEQAIRSPNHQPIMASDPVAQANITPFDRGVPERKLLTAGPQV